MKEELKHWENEYKIWKDVNKHLEKQAYRNIQAILKSMNEIKKEDIKFDINNDGKVDDKDVSLAAKIVKKVGSSIKKKKAGKK